MIYKIKVRNPSNEELVLELARPELSGFTVLSAKGLGPGKATLNMTELSAYNGSIFNSSRIEARNIVVSLEFLFDGAKTIEELRHLSYKFFPLAKRITLEVETDTRKCEIDGYVESNDPNIFSQKEGSDISIICPDPLFRSKEEQVVVFSGIEPLFEFPFSNESLTDPLLELGEIRKYSEQYIYYDGDANTGVTFKIHASDSPTGNITIYNTGTKEKMVFDMSKIETLTGKKFSAGDDLIVCTKRGKKSIVLVREGKEINVLNCLTKESTWIELTKGENKLAYDEGGSSNLTIEMSYDLLYEGV